MTHDEKWNDMFKLWHADQQRIMKGRQLTFYEQLWYEHLEHCAVCVDEAVNRCLIGEMIFKAIVNDQNNNK